MRRITKNWVSLTLTVSMLIPMLPGKVFAENETEQVMDEQSLTEIHSAEFPVEAVPEAEATGEEQINEANTDVFSDYLTDFPEALLDGNDDTMPFNSDEEIELMSTSGGSGSVTWTLDDNGVLTVSGEGKMTDTSWDKSKITSVIIENGVTSIGNSAFSRCLNLTSITLPDSVTSIGYGAFYLCSNLTSVTLPDSLKSIGGYAFSQCTGLTSITIPDGVTNIGDYMFYYCSNLTSVTLPDGVTSIGGYAFQHCTGLTSVTLPDSVTSIGRYAFYGCTGLTSIEIPNRVTSIGGDAFYGCTGLTSIEIPGSVTSIGYSAFGRCTGLTNIVIPETLKRIGGGAFSGCSNLETAVIGAEMVEGNMFGGCGNLKSVIFTDNVTSFDVNGGRGDPVFEGCGSLKEVVLPASLTHIGCNIKSNAMYYVVLGSVAHEYVLKNNLNYEDMFMDKRIKLTVNGAEGEIGSDDYTVRWYEKGSDAIMAMGAVFLDYDPDKEFEYEVIPLNDYIYSYYPSQRQPLIPEQTDEGYFADYTLLPINEVKASGTVTDKKGNPISGAAVELTQNYSAQAAKTVSTVTDENGRYTADLMDVPTTAVCSGDEYYTTTAEVIKSRANASECRVAPIVLEDMPKNKITLSVNIQEPARAGEKAALTPITNFNDITFELYNETTQSAVNFRTQYPCVYPEEGEISEGDTVKVKAVNTSGSEVEATAIIGSDI